MSSWVPAPDSPRSVRFTRETPPLDFEADARMLRQVRRETPAGLEFDASTRLERTILWMSATALVSMVGFAIAFVIALWGHG